MSGAPKSIALLRGGMAKNIVILLFIFGFVPLCILSLIFFSLYFEGQKKGIANVQKEMAERLSGSISSYFEKTTGQVQLFARLLNLENQTRRNLEYLAHDILEQWLDYDMITVAHLEGFEICKVSRHYTFSPSELGTLALDPSFISALDRQTQISQVEISGFSRFPHVRITEPIIGAKDRLLGVLDVSVNVSRMWEIISKYRIGENRYAYVVDSKGTLIAYEDISSVLQKRDLKEIQGVKEFLQGKTGVFEYDGLHRDRVIGATAIIPLTGWGIFVEQPVNVAYRDLYFLSAIFLSIFVVTVLCAVYLGFRFSFKNIVLPIRRFQEEAALIAKGDFHRRIDMQRPDELGQLAESFNSMLSDLQKTVVSRDLLVQEIEERKRAEEGLRMSLAMLARTERLAHIGSWQGDNISDEVKWSEETFSIAGRDLALGAPTRGEFWQYVHPDDVPVFKQCILQAQVSGTPFRKELRLIRPDGSIRHVLVEGEGVRDEAGGIDKIHGFILDITGRRKAEEALRESEEKYRDLVENINDIIYATDERGIVAYVSPSIESVSGYRQSETIGRPFTDFIYHEDLPRVMERLPNIVSGNIETTEDRILTKSGEIVWVRSSSRPIFKEGRFAGLRGSFTDITDMKRLESELRQAQKMEAIGTLSGGIAHDFNNILGIIVGNTELAMLDLQEGKPANSRLQEVRKACIRARDLVQEILSFSRQAEPERRPVKLSLLLQDSLKLLRSSIPTSIDIRQSISCERDIILADPTQINQVLLNLGTNATHAMRERGGVLEISLSDVRLDGESGESYPDLRHGEYLKLSVSDTGHGIRPAIMERIFDPYFTTKGVGEGTGLGLAVVHGIVKGHGGAISVDSQVGRGTTFHVLLPKIEGEPESKVSTYESLPKGSERILFVDDEQAIVEAFHPLLERLGYNVITRASSYEALKAFRASPEEFDLVITDQTMPGMTGEAFARELMAIRPDIPVILCTGFSDLINAETAMAMGIKAFVMKPVVLRVMARTIRRVLDEKR